MAKYKKRPDGRYATSVITGYKDDGKPIRKTIYGRTIRELDDKFSEFKTLRSKGIVIDDKNITFGEWADKWLELYKRGKSYNTYTMYKTALNRFEPIRDIRLSSLKKHQIQEILNEISSTGALRSAEIALLTVRQIIKSAIDEQYIYVDCTRGLTVPKRPTKEKRALTDDEIQLIKEAELTAKERAFVELLLYCGLRRGEALALSPSDICGDVIRVNKALIFKGNTPEMKDTPKSDKSLRDVPIPSALRSSLDAQAAEASSVLFPMNTKDEYMTKSSFRKFWKGIIKKTGLPDDVTPHILRHTYATRLFYGGVDVKTAQRLLGHSTVQMTLDVYTHLQNDMDDTKSKIDAAFGM